MVRLILLRFLESYFRHRWLSLLPIVLMAGVAMLSIVSAKTTYISQGVIYVRKETLLASLTSLQDTGFSWVTPAQATVDEMRELMQTDSFIRSVVQQTDLESEMSKGPIVVKQTIDEARQAAWIQTMGKNLVAVGTAHGNGPITQQIVAAIFETYIQWKINASAQQGVQAQTFFAGLIQEYKASMDQAQAAMDSYLTDHPGPVRGDRPPSEQQDVTRLQSAIDLAATRLATALDKEENARLALTQAESDARQTYLVIDAPPLPVKPETSLKSTAIKGLIFVVAGVFLSVGGVVVGALIDRSFRFPIDVRHGLDLPVLATVPVAAPRGRAGKGKAPSEPTEPAGAAPVESQAAA